MPKRQTFAGLPEADLDTLSHAKVVVLGASEASPYVAGERSHSAEAPAMLRKASAGFAGSLGQFDFDIDATLFPDKEDRRGCVDAGDVPTHPWDAEGNRARVRDAVARVLAAGAVPIVLGGDDSVPIPAIGGFEGHGPLTILQVDAHVDWADVIQGNPTATARRCAAPPNTPG